jgi:hypothetical protein
MATSGRGSGVVGYNVQVAVDTKHHLIVTHEVTNVGNDLLVRRRQHLHIECLQPLCFLLQLCDLLFEASGTSSCAPAKAPAGRRYRVGANSARRSPRSAPILARVKFLSRLLTALNLLPSIATLASANRPIVRQSTTNRLQTWRMARPLSLRKSAIVAPVSPDPASG